MYIIYIMKNIKLIYSTICFLIVIYVNEWLAINQPAPKNNTPLKDEMHELFPEISPLYANGLLVFFIIYFICRLFRYKDSINILTKFLNITSIIFIIRALSFSLTRMPFTWSDCSNKSKWGHRFFFLYDIHACGDYFISGHTVIGVLILLITLNHSNYKLEKIILGILTIILLFTTVIGRLHYTVDIINGVVYSLMGWLIYNHYQLLY